MKATVPANSPALCLECRGRGCRYCQGGLVCPDCRGRRVDDRYQICRTCCEGNQINPRKERRAILAHLTAMSRSSRYHSRRRIA